MNGAESLIKTLVDSGVEVCFTNPGTSEMHFVAALDEVEGMRCVLGLFEGFRPKFVKQYVNLRKTIGDAVQDYIQEVKEGSFPGKEHVFKG